VGVLGKYFPINLKKWFPITDILNTGNVYRYVTSETNKERKKNKLPELKSDGIILQPNDTVYVTFREWNKYNNVQFKWKPSDQLTIDFQIKIMSKDQWNLLSNTGMQFMVQQPKGRKPVPAMCFPTAKQQNEYSDLDVVEFKYQQRDNPERNLFTPVRKRNEKKANGYKTIMSTLSSIENPFELESIKEPLSLILKPFTKESLRKILPVFTKSDLILFILNKKNQLFFNEPQIKKIKEIYTQFNSETNAELEFRVYTGTKKATVMDKTNFYYLLDFLWDSFEHTYSKSIDVYLNKRGNSRFRSTYKTIKDVYLVKPYENIEKTSINSFKIEQEKKLFNDLAFKLDLSIESPSSRIIKDKNQISNEVVTNMIRAKERYTFVAGTWKIDLTKVKTGYVLSEIESKNENFECECEYIGGKNVPFEDFLSEMNTIYTLLLSNSSYC